MSDACKENDFPSPVAYTQGSGLWVVFNYSDAYVNKLSAIDRGEKIWFDPENGMGSGTINGSLNGSLNDENKGISRGFETQNGSLNKRQLSIIEMIGDYGAINAMDLAEKQKSSLRTMYRALSVLSSVDFGLVTREGSKKTGNYVLTLLGKTYYMNYIKKSK